MGEGAPEREEEREKEREKERGREGERHGHWTYRRMGGHPVWPAAWCRIHLGPSCPSRPAHAPARALKPEPSRGLAMRRTRAKGRLGGLTRQASHLLVGKSGLTKRTGRPLVDVDGVTARVRQEAPAGRPWLNLPETS